MGTQNDRLREARAAAGLPNAAAAIRKHRWTPTTYRSHENGQTPRLPHDAAIEYAKAYKVSLAWLLTGEGEMRPGGRDKFLKLFDALPPAKQPRAIEFLEFLKNQRE